MLTGGIYDAVLADRDYSTASLRRALQTSRRLPPTEAVRSLLSDLRAFLQDSDLDDDAVAVCIDWIGPRGDELPAADGRSWILLWSSNRLPRGTDPLPGDEPETRRSPRICLPRGKQPVRSRGST